jgi:hypothetical protein
MMGRSPSNSRIKYMTSVKARQVFFGIDFLLTKCGMIVHLYSGRPRNQIRSGPVTLKCTAWMGAMS